MLKKLDLFVTGELTEGVLIERSNRFLAICNLYDKGQIKNEKVHVHDPGRLKELLYPGNKILVRRAPEGTKRKTKWDMIAARYDNKWIFINSAYHRKISEYILNDESINPFGIPGKIIPEVSFGHSRIDFVIRYEDDGNNDTYSSNRDIAIEVKGCTLAINGKALFPDAPTSRGARHIDTLLNIKNNGMRAGIMMLVFRDAECFLPFEKRDPIFAEKFYKGIKEGIEIHALQLEFDGLSITYRREIPVC